MGCLRLEGHTWHHERDDVYFFLLDHHVSRRTLRYLDLANLLTAFAKADYEWTEHDATSMMHDSNQRSRIL